MAAMVISAIVIVAYTLLVVSGLQVQVILSKVL